MTDYVPRELAPRLEQALRQMPVVVLSGLRQTGKSTLLLNEKAFKNRPYASLDDFAILEAAQRNPEQLLRQNEVQTLDEVQKCPKLFTAIKSSVDQQRRKGMYLLSGSANLALLGQVAETLAGRAVYFTLQPMSRREIRRATHTAPFLIAFIQRQELPTDTADPVHPDEILAGGMPSVCWIKPADARVWFKGYEQTYIERDVRQLAQISDLIAFRTLAQLAALRSGQVLNISNLARDAKMSAATTGRYLHLLEASFLVRRVPPFMKNRSTRLIKSPKLFMTDSGIACHLGGIQSLAPGADEPLRGALLETYVFQNVAAILEAHLPEAELGYWHEQGRHEVDMVIEWNRRVIAIEIKWATRWNASDLAGLHAFIARTPQCVAGVLAYNGTRCASIGPKLWAIPIGHLLG